ncbi:H-type small acid-soluble spore protein [Gracilibacillus sp. YIM 98692]|uniref:H-type small acid-soluble spore protein n=1 Tax=Gracilibacillus sp. YIM 98692 TaxID=2663532 RepID=UPI0013D5A34F|nr:H-type small acid-soluble spore protein [Gracilibacillus sp. YIM 98692]
MNAERAQEIVESPNMLNVTYNGDKVYIEHVDQGTGHATVHPLNNPNQKVMVSIDELNEQ